MASIARRILEICRERPDRPAARDGRETISYRDLAERAEAVRAALGRAGLGAGEPVVVPVSNAVPDVAAFLGAWLAGGVAVPVDRAAPAPAARVLVERVGARLATGAAGRPAAWLPGGDSPVAVLTAGASAPRPLLDGAGTIVFTSGSTGAPKGVVLSAERASAKLDAIDSVVAMEAGARTLVVLRLTFSFGQWVTWLTLLRGGTLVLRERYRPDEVAALLAAGEVDRVGAVPTMLRRLLPALPGEARAWSGTVLSGGEPLPAALGRQVRGGLPAAGLGDIYGLTETGTSDFFVRPREYDRLAGSIGYPGPGIEHRVAGGGELRIRSPFGMLGYLDDPVATEDAFVDGYFRTGDLVAVRSDGALALVGRAGDMVNRAGRKVAPLEVEGLFLEHPDVAGALAAGVPDPATGEALHLAVVPRPGAALDPARLADWGRERLERFKLPDRIHVVDDLPAGGTGKADRGALRAMVRSRGGG